MYNKPFETQFISNGGLENLGVMAKNSGKPGVRTRQWPENYTDSKISDAILRAQH